MQHYCNINIKVPYPFAALLVSLPAVLIQRLEAVSQVGAEGLWERQAPAGTLQHQRGGGGTCGGSPLSYLWQLMRSREEEGE